MVYDSVDVILHKAVARRCKMMSVMGEISMSSRHLREFVRWLLVHEGVALEGFDAPSPMSVRARETVFDVPRQAPRSGELSGRHRKHGR